MTGLPRSGTDNSTPDAPPDAAQQARTRPPRRASDAAHELLRASIDALDENFLLCDADDRIRLFNRRYRDSAGDEPEIGQRFEDFIRARVARGRFPAALGREEAWIAERLAARRTGAVLELQIGDQWHLVRDRRLADGATVTVGFDITDRKLAEQARAESESRLRAIFEQAATGIAMREIGGRWIQVNQKFCDIAGYTRAELLATTSMALTPPEERDVAVDYSQRLARGDLSSYTRETRYRRKDGSDVWVNQSVNSVRNPAGRPTHSIVVIEDISSRKQAELALATSEARFRDFARASGEWFWETDALGRYTWVSDSLTLVSGQPAADIIGRDRIAVIAAGADAAAEPWASHLSALVRREPFREFRYRRRWPKGERWISSSGVPRFGEAGEFLGYRGIGSDVSERVEIERLARAADERLRAALENLGEMICLTDAEDRIVLANRLFIEFNAQVAEFVQPGRRYEEHLRAGAALGLFPDAVGREEAWVAERLALRRTPGGPVERRRQDGRWLMVDDQVLPDGGIITFGIEITERKRAEEAVRQAHERVRLAVDSSRVSFWDFNVPEASVFISGGWAGMLGAASGDTRVSLDELVGLLHPEDVPKMKAAVEAAMASDRAEYAIEHRVRTLSQSWRWVLSRGRVAERDPKGRALRVLGTFVDITERKQAEELLLNVNAELERRVGERTVALETAYRELESFSYSVSHDLRAPLRAISRYANILRSEEGSRLSERGLRYLAATDESALRMGRLTDALLALMRTSRQALAREALDMSAIARAVCDEQAAEHPAVRVEVGSLPAASGDETLVRQVFANLVGNAIKYSAREREPRLQLGAETGAPGTVYFVRDNGVGFDMAYVHKLFRPFERLHSESEFQGTGIGLALTKLIVQRHGGRIWAEAEPGKGATFRFTLDSGRAP